MPDWSWLWFDEISNPLNDAKDVQFKRKEFPICIWIRLCDLVAPSTHRRTDIYTNGAYPDGPQQGVSRVQADILKRYAKHKPL